MAFKDFAVGEILTSSDVDTYLMRQVVIGCTSSTRPASPSQGMHIYETDTNKTMKYNGSLWEEVGSRPGYAGRTADLDRTSTTLADDPQLTLPVVADALYHVAAVIIYSGDVDMKHQFSAPSGSVARGQVICAPSTHSSGVGSVDFNLVDFLGTAPRAYFRGLSSGMVCRYVGYLDTAATAGSLTFRWAIQSGPGTVRVWAGSFVKLQRLA